MMGILKSFSEADWCIHFMTAARDSENCGDMAMPGLTTEVISLNDSQFDQRVKEIAPDAVIFDRFMTEEQYASRVRSVCPDAIRILNTEDLHSLRKQRNNKAKTMMGIASSTELNDDLAYREIASILRSDLTLVISPVEYKLLTEDYKIPTSQLLYLPLFLDPAPEKQPEYDDREGFAFIGNFRHAPNWDAVLQLKRLWPSIRKTLPCATLSLYGAYPPKKAMVMHDPQQGFLMQGWVKNASEAISSHKLLLAPLRFGAGVKGKLLLSMQCGTPSITTSVGCEGISDSNCWPGTSQRKSRKHKPGCDC